MDEKHHRQIQSPSNTKEFKEMCLASFASEYRVLSKSEKSCSNRVQLENDMGFVRKELVQNVQLYGMLVFHPLKILKIIIKVFWNYFASFFAKPTETTKFHFISGFYETGFVALCNDELESVKIIVDTNRAMFEKEAETIQRAQDDLEQHGQWKMLGPKFVQKQNLSV